MNALIKEKLTQFELSTVEPYLTRLKELVGDRCEAILAYGSTLSSVTRSNTSTPDFFVIVRSYGEFYSSSLHALLNSVLPPNIYHFSVDRNVAKYNVLSLTHLRKETSSHTPDCYNLGRLSKRIALVWAKDSNFISTIADAQSSAMHTVAEKVYYLLPTIFSIEELAQKAIGISYAADVRVEAGDKVDRLFQAEKEFYVAAYQDILNRYLAPTFGIVKTASGYQKSRLGFAHSMGKLSTKYFVWKSQIRAQMRWPKGIVTVEGWVDYILAKIERTQGIHIEVTEKEKKYWYIFGWKYFFRLRKKNLIK